MNINTELNNAIFLSGTKDSFKKDGKEIEFKKATIAILNEETQQFDVQHVKVHKDCPLLDPLDVFDGTLQVVEESFGNNPSKIVKRLLSVRATGKLDTTSA